MSVFLSQPEKNSPSFSLSFPGAEGEQHRGIPLTKHPLPPQHSLTINPLPLCSHLKKKEKRKKKTPTTFLFVFLNVNASVYIEKSIVFKRVGVKDVCATLVFLTEVQPASLFCPVCSCTKDCIFPPVSCDFWYCVQN